VGELVEERCWSCFTGTQGAGGGGRIMKRVVGGGDRRSGRGRGGTGGSRVSGGGAVLEADSGWRRRGMDGGRVGWPTGGVSMLPRGRVRNWGTEL